MQTGCRLGSLNGVNHLTIPPANYCFNPQKPEDSTHKWHSQNSWMSRTARNPARQLLANATEPWASCGQMVTVRESRAPGKRRTAYLNSASLGGANAAGQQRGSPESRGFRRSLSSYLLAFFTEASDRLRHPAWFMSFPYDICTLKS